MVDTKDSGNRAREMKLDMVEWALNIMTVECLSSFVALGRIKSYTRVDKKPFDIRHNFFGVEYVIVDCRDQQSSAKVTMHVNELYNNWYDDTYAFLRMLHSKYQVLQAVMEERLNTIKGNEHDVHAP